MPRFGIEYTFVPKDPTLHKYQHMDYCVRELKARDEETFGRRAHVDGSNADRVLNGTCVEIPSPIHSTLEEAKAYYDRMMPTIRRMGLTARLIVPGKDTDTYYGTGGGHVHVELPKDTALRKRVMYNLIVMVANRPWLGWVFNEFGDDFNAKALWSRKAIRDFMKGEAVAQHNLSWCSLDGDPMVNALRNLCHHYTAINFRHQEEDAMTVEFRFFDAPRSWQQTKEHVEFALALVRSAKESADRNDSRFKAVKTKQEFDRLKKPEVVETDFRELIAELGLRWTNYSKYMQNFHDRRAYGRLV